MSIKAKIILAMLLIVIGSLSAFECYQFGQKKQAMKEYQVELLNRKVTRLSENIALPLWERDKTWVNKILATEMRDKQVYAIFIYSEGTLFSGSIRDGTWQPIDAADDGIEHISGSCLDKSVSVLHTNNKIGSVHLYLSNKFMQETLREEVLNSLLILLALSILIILFLIFVMNKIILSPLASIQRAVESMTAGDLRSDIKVKADDEIGMVAAGFNHLRQVIHEREADLLDSEEKIRLLLDSTAEGVYGIDLEGNCTFANEMCLQLLGYQHADELIGKHMHGLIHHSQNDGSSYPAKECRIYKAFMEGKGTHADDEFFWRGDGSNFLAEYSSLPMKKNGEVVGAVVTFLNITENREAEQALQTLVASTAGQLGQAYYKNAVENLYHWLGADVVILSELTEPGYAKALAMMVDGEFVEGYAYHLKGTPCATCIDGEGHSFPENIIQIFPENDDLVQREIESYIGVPVANIDGKIVGILCALSRKAYKFSPSVESVLKIIAARAGVEIERDSLEGQFHQAQKMEALGTLVGGIAHDFNNLLAGMTGNLYLAKKKVEAMPDVVQKLDNVDKLSFRAADMIQQLLTFARKGLVDIKPLPLNHFVKEALNFLRASLPENISIQDHICQSTLLINGDATQLHQVLMNLFNNARDAVEGVDDPCIKIVLEAFQPDDACIAKHAYFKVGNYVHLSVEDNGCGISRDQTKHMFEPFYTTKEPGKGTGLGLAMVFGAIKTHHGFVNVESIEGKGTTFHIYMPALEEATEVMPISTQDTAVEGRGETILLVDDEQQILETGTEVLKALGYQVIQASNGLEAFEIFSAHQGEISLVIMDIVMPKLGGVFAAERIRKIYPEIKIIFATGYDTKATLPSDVGLGGSKILSKPYDINELSKIIRNSLDA